MPKTSRRTSAASVYQPVLKVTTYDRVSSGMVALVLGLIVLVGGLAAVWLTNRPPAQEQLVPVELIEFPGGIEDGAPDETLLVESPEDPVPDASPESVPDETQQIDEVFDSVIELADVAAEQMLQQYETDAQASGTPGSREGTGRRALGSSGGDGGLPPEQRWFIQYLNQQNLDEYAKQLDFFGIELGCILPEGRMIYLSNLSQAQPTVRESTSGRSETRLYMSWQGGNLRAADETFFRKAGFNINASRVLHFYPAPLEAALHKLEREHAQRAITQIRRTYFVVVREGDSYQFSITRQSYFR